MPPQSQFGPTIKMDEENGQFGPPVKMDESAGPWIDYQAAESQSPTESAGPWQKYKIADAPAPAVTDYSSVPTSVSRNVVETDPTGHPLPIPVPGAFGIMPVQMSPKSGNEALANLKKTMRGYGTNEAETYGSALLADAGESALRPIAKYAITEVLPEAERWPVIGKAIRAGEKAPSFIKAALRGGVAGAGQGALYGGIDGMWSGVRGGRPVEIPARIGEGALIGGAGGAAFGAGAYGLRRFGSDLENVPLISVRRAGEPPGGFVRAALSSPQERPFMPLVYESPEEAASIDQRMKNVERQASAAGKYHAARGSAKTGGKLQTRIAGKF